MIKRNIWTDLPEGLESHQDDRGNIVDIFYNKNINHVGIISSKKGAVRGNHYHKQTVQHALITQGSIEYWYKTAGSDNLAQRTVLKKH